MRLDQGEKVSAVYLWQLKDDRWPDTVMLRPSSDCIDLDKAATVCRGYIPADEAKAEQDRLEKVVTALISYIEHDGEPIRYTMPRFAEMLTEMGLYRDEGAEDDA